MQPRETVVMDAADLVVSQHPKEKKRTTLQFRHSRMSQAGGCRVRLGVTHSIRSPSIPRNIPLRTVSI